MTYPPTEGIPVDILISNQQLSWNVCALSPDFKPASFKNSSLRGLRAMVGIVMETSLSWVPALPWRNFFINNMIMKLSEFKNMDLQGQVNIYSNAISVGRYETSGIIAECRQVDDFYVECEIHIHNNCNCVLYSHRNTAFLDKYFNKLPPLTLESILQGA